MSNTFEHVNDQDFIAAMGDLCCDRNETVRRCRELEDMSLNDFLEIQADKVRKNRSIAPLRSADDFRLRAVELTRERLGSPAAEGVAEALKYDVVSTADHHGAVIYAQSFQGDILFDRLTEKLGRRAGYLPILTAGHVELGNVTFARGMSVYTSRESKQSLPFFRMADHNRMSTHTPAIDRDMIRKFRGRFVTKDTEPQTGKALDEILRTVYETKEVQEKRGLAEQTTVIGALVSRHLLGAENAPKFVYLELEELTRPLLIKELKETGSIISKLVSDRCCRRKLNEIRTGNGVPLASRLFSAADEKGRKVFLTLDEDGNLTGKSKGGAVLSFRANAESLCELLSQKDFFPGPIMLAFLLAFERGITWMGGMFQALYLPEWQSCLVELLQSTGFEAEAQVIGAYDCSGYISGPMFALFAGSGYATPAGPLEMWMADTDYTEIRNLIDHTSLWDAHLIGLAEMYPDLVGKEERTEDWYRIIAEGLYGKFRENFIND